MPPPTPRMTLFGATARRNLVWILGQDFVLHQPAPHFLHGDDGGLLRRRRQKWPGAVLQLTRPLGGDDDEAVDALFRIVRNGAMGVILWSHFRHRYKPQKILFQKSSSIGPICGSIRTRRTRSARTIAASASAEDGKSLFTIT